MEIRKDFVEVEAELHKALLLAEKLIELEKDWAHNKNHEDMRLIYGYAAEHYMSIDRLYSLGRSMARGLGFDLYNVNNAAEYGTLYSWVHHMEENWVVRREEYEKLKSNALHAQEMTQRFNCVVQMVISLDEQLKILDSVKILLAILKTKRLYLLEESIINNTVVKKEIILQPSILEEFDVFISHASEDKDGFVKDFCNKLKLENIKFWYDEYEIGWGESVLRKINQGLEKSKFAIVVLSKSFLNKKWTNAELEAVLNIETNTGDVRVLPLMLGDSNDIKEILSHYPLLSAKRYLKVSDGTDLIIENLKKVLYK